MILLFKKLYCLSIKTHLTETFGLIFQACFDEFNRIEMDVLSVVAQQIHTIHSAIANKVTTFEFEGAELTLNANCSM